jgi:DUF4097 and DUF4098 domain-containing protein YvlB
VGGSLKVEGSSSSVLAESVAGDVDVVNSYRNVVLRKTGGSISVRGSSSPIEVMEIQSVPKGGKIELITTYKPITLTLPESVEAAISAVTTYGKIRSDYPVYLQESEKNIKIEVGKGGILVKLETSGDITIKK